ncbi:hypothetical protein N7540_012518 [Penicillium herquei]|nr:hypothetical protein N7540_012518 [Penicillium herquei]
MNSKMKPKTQKSVQGGVFAEDRNNIVTTQQGTDTDPVLKNDASDTESISSDDVNKWLEYSSSGPKLQIPNMELITEAETNPMMRDDVKNMGSSASDKPKSEDGKMPNCPYNLNENPTAPLVGTQQASSSEIGNNKLTASTLIDEQPQPLRKRKQLESVYFEPPRREAGFKDTTWREAGFKDTTRREVGLKDTTRREVGLKDTTWREAGFKDTTWREAGLKDTPRRTSECIAALMARDGKRVRYDY